MARILIAIPNAGFIEPETFVSIYNMEKVPNIETELRVFYGYLIDDVRNKIVDTAINEKFDGILFVDSDMKLPKDTLLKMVAHNKDIVSGIYIRKLDDEKIIEIFLRNNDLNATKPIKRITERDLASNSNLIEIAACGFGCVLVKMHVFTKIGYPYFKFTADKQERRGEDVDFSMKALQNNFKLYAITNLIVGHIGKKEYKL
jgi:GT2 family glycosyltransferase